MSSSKRKPTNEPFGKLNAVIRRGLRHARPPENLLPSDWADKYRRLSPENSAEAGPWRTSRTPYLREIMDAFVDPTIRRISVAASSQVGKTELLINLMAYAIVQDPGSIHCIMPTLDMAEDFSKRRFASAIRDCRPLRSRIAEAKSRSGDNTIMKKIYPGGILSFVGSNSAASLAAVPVRYVFGDERDRWAYSAGTEGDPWRLAEARTITYYNAKLVDVSTPTILGRSAIETSYNLGTRERWCVQCPDCGEYNHIEFKHIKHEHETITTKGKRSYTIHWVRWACPSCGVLLEEQKVKRQPAMWVAENPTAIGHRSFWINAFVSPWMSWEAIIKRFLEDRHDVERLKTFYNTIIGELWEERGELESEDEMLARREEYDAEVPRGVLVLTCGVDTQDDRLEYEVVGHGHMGETWGIRKGFILGRPDKEDVWERLDGVLDHVYQLADGKGIRISITFVDSGGHFTQEVYRACYVRQERKVFAIKGRGGEGRPLVSPATKVKMQGQSNTAWLFTLGVDSGKMRIMGNLKVQRPGAGYCHFPLAQEAGYDADYFSGLLSEAYLPKMEKGVQKWAWRVLPGHARNEPLDCRNYALAAFRALNPNLEAVERRLYGASKNSEVQPSRSAQPARRRRRSNQNDDW